MPDHQRIRELAYQLWEREGWPDGRHNAHWVQAERELGARSTRRVTSVPSCLAAFAGNGALHIHAISNDDGWPRYVECGGTPSLVGPEGAA
jgi:Protein of unknown function (DUF2934)